MTMTNKRIAMATTRVSRRRNSSPALLAAAAAASAGACVLSAPRPAPAATPAQLLTSGATWSTASAWSNGLDPTNASNASVLLGYNYQVSSGQTLNAPVLTAAGTDSFYANSLNVTSGTLVMATTNGGTALTDNYNFSNAGLFLNGSVINFTTSLGSVTKVLNGPLTLTGSDVINYSGGSYTNAETINSLVSGTGTLTFVFNGGSARSVTIANASNGYTGAVVLGTVSGASTFNLNKTLGTASSFTVGTNWTLDDNVTNGVNAAAFVATGATVIASGVSDTFGALSGAGAITASGTTALNVSGSSGGSTYSGILAGSGLSLTKTIAADSETLSGANTYAGGTNISAGRLAGSVVSAFGTGTVNVGAGANVYLNPGGTVANNFVLNGLSTYDSYGALRLDNTTLSGNVLLNGNSSIGEYSTNVGTISGVISDGGNGFGFTKLGDTTGKLILTGSNTYSGTTLVSYGTLSVANTTGSGTGTGNVINNATFASGTVGTISGTLMNGSSASTIAPGGVGTIGTLTVGGLTTAANTTISFDLGNASSGSVASNGDLFNIGSGTLSIASGTILSFNTSTTTNGVDYRLFGGAGAANLTLGNFTLPTAPNGETFALLPTTNTADPGYVDLAVSIIAARNLTWNNAGGGNGVTWDTAQLNFNNGSAAVAFSSAAMDNVTFNDVNNGTYLVNIPAVVTPGSTTVTTANTYTFNGPSGIGGTGPLTINGTGTLILANPNTFTGITSLVSGTLDLQNSLALAGSTLASPAGTLVFDSTVTGNAFTFGGLSGTGAIALQNSAGTAITLTIGANGNSSTYSGVLSGPGNLVKSGAGTLTLAGADSYAGYTNVSAGTLALGTTSALGTTVAPLYVSGGTLDLAGNTVTTGAVNLSAGSIVDSGSTPGSLTGASYTLNNGTVSAVLAGTAQVAKTAAGTLALSGTNTYTGGTLASSGTVNVSGNQTAANGGWSIGPNSAATTTVNLLAGSTVAVASTAGVTLGAVGSATQLGSAASTLNVAGTVTDAGFLSIGRSGYLAINSGGSFTESGAMSIQAGSGSGYAAYMTVNTGGSFTYSGSSTINQSPPAGATSANGIATITLSGGTFTTDQEFLEANTSSAATSLIALSGGGTLALSANVPVLAATAGNAFAITVGNGSGGVINTGAYTTSLALPITNGAALGNLTKTGAGTLALSGASTYNGGTGILAGTVLVGVSNVGTTSGALGAAAGTVSLGNATTAASVLTNGAYTLSNPVFVYLDGGYTYTIGGNTSSASTFSGLVSAEGNFTVAQPAGGTFNVTGGITSNYGGVTPTVTFAGPGNINVTGVVSNTTGTLSVNVSGGTTTFSNSNTYGGATNILPGGTLALADGGTFGSASSITDNGTVAFANATTAFTINQSITGTGSLLQSGAGTTTLTANNSYTGATNIAAGTLTLSGSGPRLSTGPLNVGVGATLFVNGAPGTGGAYPLAFANLTGGGTIDEIHVGYNQTETDTLTVGSDNTSTTFSGVIAGGPGNGSGPIALALTKVGTGTLILSGPNSYYGPTTISAGTLRAENGATSFGSGTVAVSGGVLAGSGTTGSGTVTVNSTGTITAGSGATTSDTVGTLTIGASGLVLNGGTYAVKINAVTATVDPTGTGQSAGADELVITGPVSATATPGLTVSPVELTSSGGFVGGRAYSFVIADAETTANAGVFDGLLASSKVTLPGGGPTYTDAQGTYSLATAADSSGTGGEDLLLDFTAATPEPTSLLLAGLAAAPLALGRRRRARAAS
jgi:autotransporter-associated beta strand protein